MEPRLASLVDADGNAVELRVTDVGAQLAGIGGVLAFAPEQLAKLTRELTRLLLGDHWIARIEQPLVAAHAQASALAQLQADERPALGVALVMSIELALKRLAEARGDLGLDAPRGAASLAHLQR